MSVEKDPLLTYAQIAKLADVQLGTVYMWRKRGLLPEPDPDVVGRRPLWRQSVIRHWLAASGRGDKIPGYYDNIDSDEGLE